MKQTLLFFILFMAMPSFSQDIPSLWNRFKNGSGKERVQACIQLSEYYSTESQDSLKVLGEDLFLYGIDHHYYPAIERGKLTLAQYLIYAGKAADGIGMTKALLSNMEERGDDQMLGYACRMICVGYEQQKDAESCYYWSLRALRHDKKSDDPLTKSKALTSLGEAYILQKKYDHAIDTYRKYISVVKLHHKYREVSKGYSRLGYIYQVKGNMELASRFYHYSMSYAEKTKRSTLRSHGYNNLAIIYFENGDTTLARSYFEKALELRLKTKDFRSISESYYNLGDYYFYTSDNEKAFRWYTQSLEFSRKNNLKNETCDALNALATLAKSTNDFKGATLYLEQWQMLQNEIQLQNSEDEDELGRLKEQIMRLEIEAESGKQDLTTHESETPILKWEWFVIGGLCIIVVVVLIKRRNVT